MRSWSLSQKILGLAMLNLLLAGAVVLGWMQLQYGLEADSLLAGPARDRVLAVVSEFVSEVDLAPDPAPVFRQYREVYAADFFIINPDGGAIRGPDANLPPEVRDRMRFGGGPARGKGKQDDDPGPDPNPDKERRRKGKGQGKGKDPAKNRGPLEPRERYFFVTSHDPTRYWAVVRTPVRGPDGETDLPAMVMIRSESLFNSRLFFEWQSWLGFALALLAVAAACWVPFLRGLTRAIGQVDEATQRLALGQFDTPVPEDRHDELGHLGGQINIMASRLDSFVKSQRRFLGDIAHELSAPIARIQFALGILERRVQDTHQAEIDTLRDEIQEMSSLVNELLSFSKASMDGGTLNLELLDVAEIVKQAAGRENVPIEAKIDKGVMVKGNQVYLRRAIGNVIRNAARYAGEFGPIEVAASRDGGMVRIVVSDHGPGLPADALAHIFEPFYRPSTSRSRDTGGVGLGLAIVKSCVEACGGSIRCANRDPQGLEVTLTLAAG